MLQRMLCSAATTLLYRRVARFRREALRARQIQAEVLFTKIRRNAASDFGRQHGFAEMRTVADFRRQVPIADYDYYHPYIERVKRGETEAMFAPHARILMFALTSGTTRTSKFVPITREFFDEYRASWQVWGACNYTDHRELLEGKTLQLSSNWRQFETEAGIPCGNISGLAIESAPACTRIALAAPREVVRIDDPVAKHYATLRITMAAPHVRTIITANPSTLIEFARRGDAQRESLLRDIHDGTLSAEIDVTPEIRRRLRRHTARPNRARARELEEIISRTGTLYPKDYWPGLDHLAVWMGGSVGVYLPRLEEFYGDTTLRDHGLSASEGRMTIPFADGTSAGLLDYARHYYEFIPEAEMEAAEPTVCEAHELEVGRNYYILLTTSSGLYRYDIHDVVRCEGYEGEAPILTFLNKGDHFSSITGEKLSEFQVVSAVRDATAELGVVLDHFTLAPVMEERPGYVLLVETGGRPLPARLPQRVDALLAAQNMEYAEKLQSGRLLPLRLRELPHGTWAAFRRARIAARGNLEEYKHPCLVGDLDFVDRLLGSRPHREGEAPAEPPPAAGTRLGTTT